MENINEDNSLNTNKNLTDKIIEKKENPINIEKLEIQENKNNKINIDPTLMRFQVKKSIRKNSIIPRRLSLIEKYTSLSEIPSSKRNNDQEIKEILRIIEKKYYERNEKENKTLLSFLINTHINDNLRSDLLETNISVQKLCDLIGQFISIQVFQKNNNIYIIDEKAELIYILLRGNISLYNIKVINEKMTFEQYLNFLYKIKTENKKEDLLKKEDKGELGKEFIDDYLLMNILNENKAYYHIPKNSDIFDFPDIIFLIKIYKDCIENNGENIMTLYKSNNYPLTKYNYIDVINGKIKISKFSSQLNSFFGKREYYYLQQFTNQLNPIRIIKYIRTKYLEEFDYFGNFEIIENKPLRLETAKCESSKALLLAINKKSYSSILYKEQKVIRDKELEKFHRSYIFKELNKNFFNQKIFTQFKIIDFFVDNELFKEDEKMNDFYILKEGIIELSINNHSLLELKSIIKKLYDLIKKEIRMNIFLRETMVHSYKVVERTLNLKRKFLVFTSEKGIFGDYEKYFNIPSIFTATVVSKQVKLFVYPYEKYNRLYNEVDGLKEGLKNTAMKKIRKIIERLISIYNSYFTKIENEFTIKQQEQYDQIVGNTDEKKINKNLVLNTPLYNTMKAISKHIKNNSNYIPYNNDIFKELMNTKTNNDIKKLNDNHNSELANSNDEEINQNLTRNKKFNTIYKSLDFRIRPKKLFLPSIVSNENSSVERNSSRNFSNDTFYKYNSKNNPLYISINNTKIKFPERIEKNCPLINRIRKELKKKENKSKKKIKTIFTDMIMNDFHRKKNKNDLGKENDNYETMY